MRTNDPGAGPSSLVPSSQLLAGRGPDGPPLDESSGGSGDSRVTGDVGGAPQRSDTAGPQGPEAQTAAAKAICLKLLAVSPRPRNGLAQALRRKGIPDEIAEAVLDRLTEVGLIDDAAYAQSFVRTKHRDRALGRTALRMELRAKGIDEDSAAVAIGAIDAPAEQERAEAFIARRLDAALVAGPVAARRRLLGLLARRGYPADVAVSVVDRALDAAQS